MPLVFPWLLDMNTEKTLFAFLVYSIFLLDNSTVPSSGQLERDVATSHLFSSLM